MRAVFNRTPYLTRRGRVELAEALNIAPETIAVRIIIIMVDGMFSVLYSCGRQVWFKNQRSKLKKQYLPLLNKGIPCNMELP